MALVGNKNFKSFRLRLDELIKGAVPSFSEMEPNSLYYSTNPNFPICNLLYKDMEGWLVVIQVTREDGHRKLKASAFQNMLKRLSLPKNFSKIKYIYCPSPRKDYSTRIDVSETAIEGENVTVWKVPTRYNNNYKSFISVVV